MQKITAFARNTLVAGLLTVPACLLMPANIASAEEGTKITAAQTLDELLNKARAGAKARQQINAKREAAFKADKNKQAALLAEARDTFAKEQARSEALKAAFNDNEKKLAELDNDLKVRLGELGEMFGSVRIFANDTKAHFENSMITAELVAKSTASANRVAMLTDLAERKELPRIGELRSLWLMMQEEMTESAKVTNFDATVVDPEGQASTRAVTRIGTFNLIDADRYLHFDSATGKIKELIRQPSSRHLDFVADYQSSTDAYAPVAVDPSRGGILSLLVQAKSLGERYHDGKVVGYIITALLCFGLVIVLERVIVLNQIGSKIKKQRKTETLGDNPLGRILKVYQSSKYEDVENMELKLDEAILKELPIIERGIQIIKVLAAIAPLLGLLGTVTGMIATFQSITLYGTGDPKLMADGISTALVTTVLGLCAAIPLILLHSVVAGKSKHIIAVLEEQSAGLIAQHAEDQKKAEAR